MTVLDIEHSLSGLSWKMPSADDRCTAALAQQFNLSETVARIMASRGITPDTAPAFLFPTLKENLPNPLTLRDMERAAERMADAVMAGEPIGLMGDYDVDGATSTSVLKLFLEDIGVTVHTFIP